MRVIFADPGLRGSAGHHLGYADALAEAARQRGLAAPVLTHRSFVADPEVSATQFLPRFSARYQTSGSGGAARAALLGAISRLPDGVSDLATRLLRRARRTARGGQADSFGTELAAALRELAPTGDDVLVLPSISAANLGGLAGALDPEAVARLVIVLRRLPAEMDDSEPGPEPTHALLRRLQAHLGPRLFLFADTDSLAALWSSVSGLPVATVPLPVKVPANPPRTRDGLPHLVFPGGARSEKGYTLLPKLIAELRGRARFTLHSGAIDRSSEPVVQRAHRTLQSQAGPDLRLIEHDLEPAAYLDLLLDADLLLLPYDPNAYGPRSSGILAEARSLALPAVVPRGCWMEEVAGPAQRLAFAFPDGFEASVHAALAELAPLTQAMREAAPEWRTRHNPGSVLDVLLGDRSGL